MMTTWTLGLSVIMAGVRMSSCRAYDYTSHKYFHVTLPWTPHSNCSLQMTALVDRHHTSGQEVDSGTFKVFVVGEEEDIGIQKLSEPPNFEGELKPLERKVILTTDLLKDEYLQKIAVELYPKGILNVFYKCSAGDEDIYTDVFAQAGYQLFQGDGVRLCEAGAAGFLTILGPQDWTEPEFKIELRRDERFSLNMLEKTTKWLPINNNSQIHKGRWESPITREMCGIKLWAHRAFQVFSSEFVKLSHNYLWEAPKYTVNQPKQDVFCKGTEFVLFTDTQVVRLIKAHLRITCDEDTKIKIDCGEQVEVKCHYDHSLNVIYKDVNPGASRTCFMESHSKISVGLFFLTENLITFSVKALANSHQNDRFLWVKSTNCSKPYRQVAIFTGKEYVMEGLVLNERSLGLVWTGSHDFKTEEVLFDDPQMDAQHIDKLTFIVYVLDATCEHHVSSHSGIPVRHWYKPRLIRPTTAKPPTGQLSTKQAGQTTPFWPNKSPISTEKEDQSRKGSPKLLNVPIEWLLLGAIISMFVCCACIGVALCCLWFQHITRLN